MKTKSENQMSMTDKIYGCIQIAVAVIALLFALFNLVRTVVQHSSGVYIAAFVIMTVAAYCFLEVSIEEYRENKKV